MTPEQAGWAILTGAVIFGGELVVWFQSWLERDTRRFSADLTAVLRSRTPGGSVSTPDRHNPQVSSGVLAGGEARAPSPVYAALPPAPLTLVGAADPRPAALTRPPRVRLGGEL